MRHAIYALFMGVAAALPASAQTPLDAADPSITQRPRPDFAPEAGPDYPQEALRKRQQGEVKLRMCVDVSGTGHSAEIVESSGFQLLDQTSLNWLNGGAKFKPAEASGAPVAVCNYVFTWAWSLPEDRGGGGRIDTSDYLDASELAANDLPKVLRRPTPPDYPAGARARRSEGTIHYSMCIGPDGQMKSLTILDGDSDMELAVAGTRWFGGSIYAPGQKNGQPVGVCGIQDAYTWKLPSQ